MGTGKRGRLATIIRIVGWGWRAAEAGATLEWLLRAAPLVAGVVGLAVAWSLNQQWPVMVLAALATALLAYLAVGLALSKRVEPTPAKDFTVFDPDDPTAPKDPTAIWLAGDDNKLESKDSRYSGYNKAIYSSGDRNEVKSTRDQFLAPSPQERKKKRKGKRKGK
jgi:hypothetical protein